MFARGWYEGEIGKVWQKFLKWEAKEGIGFPNKSRHVIRSLYRK